MFGIGVPELVLILIIGLVVFGPGKLPEIGKAVGKSLNEFKKATSNLTAEDKTKAKAEIREAEVLPPEEKPKTDEPAGQAEKK